MTTLGCSAYNHNELNSTKEGCPYCSPRIDPAKRISDLEALLWGYRTERGTLSHAKQCFIDVTDGDESDDRCSLCKQADILLGDK